MRQPVYKRLRKLEEASARTRKQCEGSDADSGKALRKVHLFLRLRGVEPGPSESVAEALARALEIIPAELQRLLQAGIDPIHQYFADRGIYEANQTRKAAGTIAGG